VSNQRNYLECIVEDLEDLGDRRLVLDQKEFGVHTHTLKFGDCLRLVRDDWIDAESLRGRGARGVRDLGRGE
jgi:hypothetical protein